MKTNLLSILIASILVAVALYFGKQARSTSLLPPSPTNGKTIVKTDAEEADNQDRREAWFELMHQAAPGTNWRQLEYQTAMQRHKLRVLKHSSTHSRAGGEELAGGNLYGEWKERGSRNMSGSVFVTEYDPQFDKIYLISAGHTLWRGSRDGFEWEPVNEDLRFYERFLKIIPTDSGTRMLAIMETGMPHYSDDYGETWQPASGIELNDSNARTCNAIVLNDAQRSIFMLSKPSYWAPFKWYRSTDYGETYQEIHAFEDHDSDHFYSINPHSTNDIYLAQKINGNITHFYKYNTTTESLELYLENEDFGFITARANLKAIQMDTVRRFWSFNGDKELFISDDECASWTKVGELPELPWRIGIFIPPSNPEMVMMGAVECFKSLDGGLHWLKQNGWGQYYNDMETKLHADIMWFDEFETSAGQKFILISNHGGLSISYDQMETTPNIGLLGLNVSQYYDVRTDPENSIFVYAGSQDQGFQRGFGFTNDVILSMEQAISGDYGHMAFTGNGQHLWMVYPGGWVSYWDNPKSGGIADSWTVESEDESVWIPPLIPHPQAERDAVLLAGGSKNGGDGSYIIQLEYINNGLEVSQLPFNFLDEAEAAVSALGYSPLNDQKWYAATSNGRFFYSHDAGMTWEQTLDFIPTGNYLYGATIYSSKIDENTVYFGGSGYSNPAVHKSTDGGQNFFAMNQGLPPTLVFELTANADESLIFAATESGPFVYVVEEAKWYDMSGMGAPAQTYWSVEYLEEDEIVRFGTYGRGIWDFQIQDPVSNQNPLGNQDDLKLFPNPVQDYVHLQIPVKQKMAVRIAIYDLRGRLLSQQTLTLEKGKLDERIDSAALPSGSYILQIQSEAFQLSKKFVRL